MQEFAVGEQPEGPRFNIMKTQPLAGCNAGNNGGAEKWRSTQQVGKSTYESGAVHGMILAACFHVAEQI